MQPEKVIEVRTVRGPSGHILIDVAGPLGQKIIYTPDESVHAALLMLAVASTAYDSAVEFASVIDRARAAIAIQPSGGPLQYQPGVDAAAAERPQ
jgi:hypothetical protein